MKKTENKKSPISNGSAKAVVGFAVRVHKNNVYEAAYGLQEIIDTYGVEKVDTYEGKKLCITFNSNGNECAFQIMSDEEEKKYFRDLKMIPYGSSM